MRRDVAAGSRHGPLAQLLIAWSPLSVILLAYAVAGWVNDPIEVGRTGADTNRLGFELQMSALADADKVVFGTVPSAWLQERLVDGFVHWYDAVAALVYITHFVAIPALTAAVWFRWRERFAVLVGAVLTFTALGAGGYVAYPAAPPWLASEQGVIRTVHRVSGTGWDYLHLGAVERLLLVAQEGSNPVAAMPSLHAGSALLVALFLWPVATSLWRAALSAYVVSMAATLIYTGEHYVVDVLAGWLTATLAVLVGHLTRRQRAVEVSPARRWVPTGRRPTTEREGVDE